MRSVTDDVSIRIMFTRVANDGAFSGGATRDGQNLSCGRVPEMLTRFELNLAGAVCLQRRG